MTKPSPTNREINIQTNDFLVSKTDSTGRINYANPAFIKVTGFSEKELLGKPHSFIRHKEMPKIIFKLLWEKISQKREIFAYIKNMSKDGSFYWVYANVTASLDVRNNIIGYYSVRRKANPKALEVIRPLYDKLLSLESSGGVDASYNYLTELLNDKGVSYDEFSNNLQRL